MGNRTKIGYCDSTANPVIGCDGCELLGPKRRVCYAASLAARWAANPAYPDEFSDVLLKPGVMAKAARWSDLRGKERPGKPWLDGFPRHIFIGDMGDVLSRAVSFEFLREEVIDVVCSEAGRRHIWMLLTKRAHRLLAFDEYLEALGLEWPSNLYAMVSVTSELSTPRIASLVRTRARVKGISYEPALGPVDWRGVLKPGDISLLVIGGESGARKTATPFNVRWAEETLEACAALGIVAFVKQLGSRPYCERKAVVAPQCAEISLGDRNGADMAEWGEFPHLRVRRMPPALRGPSTEMMTWCLRCRAKISHSEAVGCGECHEILCPTCYEEHGCKPGMRAEIVRAVVADGSPSVETLGG